MPLPNTIAAVANSSQFLPPGIREALHDIAALSGAALQQLEQVCVRQPLRPAVPPSCTRDACGKTRCDLCVLEVAVL